MMKMGSSKSAMKKQDTEYMQTVMISGRIGKNLGFMSIAQISDAYLAEYIEIDIVFHIKSIMVLKIKSVCSIVSNI